VLAEVPEGCLSTIGAPPGPYQDVHATKILVTAGPASLREGVLEAIVAAGASAVRVNASHLSSAEVAHVVAEVRRRVPSVAVLLDVQGPKLRLVDGIDATGDQVVLVHDRHATGDPSETRVGFDPHRVGIRPGERILVNDGRIELRAVSVEPHRVVADVVEGGRASGRRGVNLPDTRVHVPLLGRKDLDDIEAGLSAGVNWVALSFVETAADVEAARKLLPAQVKLMAKIERPLAVENIEAICAVADGVMAARGDLGVELSYSKLPVVTRRIAAAALEAGKVAVCATEMLESMITMPRPTRAEVSDVANAVHDGFDAVMLSAETAIGEHPVRAVAAMADILTEAESVERPVSSYADAHPDDAAVAADASALAERLGARSIVAMTSTGYVAGLISACRPSARIVAATQDADVAAHLNLRYGVVPVLCGRPGGFEDATRCALDAAVRAGLAAGGERVVVCASRLGPGSDADTVLVHVV